MAAQVEQLIKDCKDCGGKFPINITAKAFLKDYRMKNFVFFRADDLCTGLRNELSQDLLPFMTESDYQIVVTYPPWVAIKRKDAEAKVENLGENHGQYCR